MARSSDHTRPNTTDPASPMLSTGQRQKERSGYLLIGYAEGRAKQRRRVVLVPLEASNTRTATPGSILFSSMIPPTAGRGRDDRPHQDRAAHNRSIHADRGPELGLSRCNPRAPSPGGGQRFALHITCVSHLQSAHGAFTYCQHAGMGKHRNFFFSLETHSGAGG